MQAGRYSYTAADSEEHTVQINFVKPFNSIPVVVASAERSGYASSTSLVIRGSSVTQNGFSVDIELGGGNKNVNIAWIAFEYLSK